MIIMSLPRLWATYKDAPEGCIRIPNEHPLLRNHGVIINTKAGPYYVEDCQFTFKLQMGSLYLVYITRIRTTDVHIYFLVDVLNDFTTIEDISKAVLFWHKRCNG